jgi:hypothetical protein
VSAAAERAGASAVVRVVEAMAALVAADGPGVSAEPVVGGLRLSGPRLAVAAVEDVRLRALAAQAVRVRP